MRILVTNDDGINAPGLLVAEEIARQLSDDVWVVAPASEQSGKSHGVTFRQNFFAEQIDDKRFAVGGTPADCVVMGVAEFMPQRPDLIISGVNAGSNVGDAVLYSGTAGAAEEGALQGIMSIALSQEYDWAKSAKEIAWNVARDNGPQIIKRLMAFGQKEGSFFNVNFPNCPDGKVEGVQICRQGHSNFADFIQKRHEDGKDVYFLGLGHATAEPLPGTDRKALLDNCISISPIRLDRTHCDIIEQMKGDFDES